MKKKLVRNETTPSAKRLWAAVDKAAAKSPARRVIASSSDSLSKSAKSSRHKQP